MARFSVMYACACLLWLGVSVGVRVCARVCTLCMHVCAHVYVLGLCPSSCNHVRACVHVGTSLRACIHGFTILYASVCGARVYMQFLQKDTTLK